MPDSGQLRSLPVDEEFILPRSGFVQQIVQVRFASKLAPPDAATLRHLTKTYRSGHGQSMSQLQSRPEWKDFEDQGN
jgi:hypothetical protein